MHHKRKKRGFWGKMVKVFVAIAYGHGAVLCEQYDKQLTGQFFADFVREHFENAFENSSNPRGKLFLQDGDPSQNSLKVKNAIFDIGARMFSIQIFSFLVYKVLNFQTKPEQRSCLFPPALFKVQFLPVLPGPNIG